MNLSEQLLSALSAYGLPALFIVVAVGSIGVPMPLTLLLVAAGAFVDQGEMTRWQVVAVSCAAAVLGDSIGFAIGRWGGRRLVLRVCRRFKNGERRLEQAEALMRRRGGLAVFTSRWLVTPIAPFLNVTGGAIEFSWSRFLACDVAGQLLWVVIYVTLGELFSDRVEALSETLGDVTWAILALLLALVFGWKIFKMLRANRKQESAATQEVLAASERG